MLVTKGGREVLMKKAKYLADRNDEYVIKVVNGNYELISELFHHKTVKPSDYTASELNFIKSVKRYIVSNEVYLRPEFEKQYFSEDVHYMKVARVPLGQTFEDVFEVDIDEAYWKTAHLLGIISDSLYKRGAKGNISKQCRLTALGSLAKKVYYYEFKGKALKRIKTDKDPLLENLWFTICKRVSDVMHETIKSLGDDFIFYWVDGIYVKGKSENITKCIDIFNKWGYNSKYKQIKKIHFHEKGFTCNDFGTATRDFNYPNYSSKADKPLTYSEDKGLRNLAYKILNQDYDIVDSLDLENDNE